MISAIHAARVLLGSALIILGLVGFILPLIPGAPIVVWGFNVGFTWHPCGLRVWRRGKSWAFRGLKQARTSLRLS